MVCHCNHAFPHSPNWFIMGICFRILGVLGINLAPIKIVLGCKAGQIISWRSCFEVEISKLLIMFVDVFNLLIRLS